MCAMRIYTCLCQVSTSVNPYQYLNHYTDSGFVQQSHLPSVTVTMMSTTHHAAINHQYNQYTHTLSVAWRCVHVDLGLNHLRGRCDAAWWHFEWPWTAEAMAKFFQLDDSWWWRGLLLGRSLRDEWYSRTYRAEPMPKFLQIVVLGRYNVVHDVQHESWLVCTFTPRAEPMSKTLQIYFDWKEARRCLLWWFLYNATLLFGVLRRSTSTRNGSILMGWCC